MRPADPIACPFVYSSGKACEGHIERVEAIKADLEWTLNDGAWKLAVGEARSHFHVYCSLKGNHAGHGRSDFEQLKFYLNELPAELLAAMEWET